MIDDEFESSGLANLFQHYHYTCSILHGEVHKRRRHLKLKSNDVRKDEFVKYYELFLSMLYVVCEGFKSLEFDNPAIDKLIGEHFDSLRLFRNGTFHYQPNSYKHVQFFDGTGNRMNWAEDLYFLLTDHFQTEVILNHIDMGRVKIGLAERVVAARSIQDAFLNEERNYTRKKRIIARVMSA